MLRPVRTVPATCRRSTRYLSEETDRRKIIGGLKMARRIFAAPTLQRFVREETLPGREIQSDDQLLDYARRDGSICYHASCTCMMGSHAMSVVDDELKVHGLECLRVIDASVMPAVTSTNTNAPMIMIAERGLRSSEAPFGKDWRCSKAGAV
jgi:choline dehydrogenase